MPNRSSSPKPPGDPVASAFRTIHDIIARTEADAAPMPAADRVRALERLCAEVRDFARVARLPDRVVLALDDAAHGRPLPTDTLLPVTPEDFPEPASVAFARAGGLKGGKARAQALSPRRRRDIARKAARARWKGK